MDRPLLGGDVLHMENGNDGLTEKKAQAEKSSHGRFAESQH